MRLLIDSSVSSLVAAAVRDAGHDADWVGDWGGDPGDEEILAAARETSRTLVTLDKDFGELAVLRAQSHFGIIRLVDLPLSSQAARCIEALESYGAELTAGAIVTIERGRIRIRPAALVDQ